MKDEVYSPFKAAFHNDKIEQLKKGELITPVFAQIDWSNRCNLNCSFCFYHIYPLSDWDPNAIIPRDIGILLINGLKKMGVKALEHTGGGSVETHPDWKELLQYSKDEGFQNALVTNGTLLDEEGLQLIRDFDWVRFSIDAAHHQTYSKVKGVDTKFFFKAIENMKRLIEIKDPKNIVGFSFVVCRENYKEIFMAATLAKELGCDNIRFSLAMTPKKEKLFVDIWDEIVKQLEEVRSLEDKNFRVFTFSNRINEVASKVFSDYCGYHHFCAVISPTGVYPCCRLKDEGKFNFGRVQDKTFKEIWFGEKRKQFIKSIKNGCPYSCWMTDKNNFIKYLMLDSPMHVNFI